MERKRSAGHSLARFTRDTKPAKVAPPVIRTSVLRKPAPLSSLSIALAGLRLNSYSGTPRALIAPGISAVWPTSTRMRNYRGRILPEPSSSSARLLPIGRQVSTWERQVPRR